LNPNIPWKTRGNGAISIQFGLGYGKKFLIGEIDEKIYGYSNGNKIVDIDRIAPAIDEIVKRNAELDQGADPGIVITKKKTQYELYKKTVREIVSLSIIKKFLKKIDAKFISYKNGRGLIGATAAVSWKPIRDRTYELLTYRMKDEWGTKRKIDEKSVIKMDRTCYKTFDNYDYENKKVIISPNSPCPVLYGIRGDIANELMNAMEIVESESIDRWLIFETNQATDEHLQRKEIGKIEPFQSVIVSGEVSSEPMTIRGGHVFFSIGKNGKEAKCAAYEPTKGFRDVARKLHKGDIVTVYGGIREKPLTINIEKMKLEKLAIVKKKVGNPICTCGKRMKSIGMGKGYRCPRCGKKSSSAQMKIVEREIKEGFYEVPPSARRHLAKPLKRMR
jgi:tRNA(Ile2)-agmatinylcytidine synthase